MPTPTPVFVLGMARSGTTWISNLLLEHSAIVGIRLDFGIHESCYFSTVDGRFGPLDVAVNFVEFAEVMAASYVFRAAGVDRDFLYAQYPASYAEVFRAVMDHHTSASGGTHWIEKTPLHTLYGEAIAESYPDARFITIERDVREVLRSRLQLLDRIALKQRGKLDSPLKRWASIAMGVATWHHYGNAQRRLAKRHPERTLAVTYAGLKADTEGTTREMSRFLGIEFEPSMLSSPYRANTSFTDEPKVRSKVISLLEAAWLSMWNVVMGLMPGPILKLAYGLGTLLEGQQRKLPFFFFRRLPDTPEALSAKLF